MNSERLSYLISLYLDGALSPVEKLEFENALLSSSAARSQFWDETKLHEQLRTVEQQDDLLLSVTTPLLKDSQVRVSTEARSKINWLFRPLTAAAAGIVLSALCTSAVWAYTGQRLAAKVRALPIANPSFESAEQMAPNGIPETAGKWSGDFARVVTGENGIQPHQGKQMLRFLSAANSLARPGGFNYVGEAVQVLDLRPFRSELSTNTAQIEITGWFASIPVEGQQFHFLIKAATFIGDPKDAPDLWEDIANSSLSLVQHQIPSGPTPRHWQALTVSIPVPPAADFLVFECGVLRRTPRVTEGTAEFQGHYVDDISLRMSISNPSANALSSTK